MKPRKHLINSFLLLSISLFFACGSQNPIYNTANSQIPGKINFYEASNLHVSENGIPVSYSISLSREPIEDVEIKITPDSGLTLNDLCTPLTLTFTPDNWDTAQSVNVNVENNFTYEGTRKGTLTYTVTSADPYFNDIDLPDLEVSIMDDDVPGVIINETDGSTQVTEGGNSDIYSISLACQPESDVTININVDTNLSVSSTNLTFTAANWFQNRTIEVTAINDGISQGPHSGLITHTITSGDTNFSGLEIDDVNVAIIDAIPVGTHGLIISKSGVKVAEEGETEAEYKIQLASQPTADVEVYVHSPAAPDIQITVSPTTTLVFTTTTWDVNQTVTIKAVDDGLIEEHFHLSSVGHSSHSVDPNYVISLPNSYNISVRIIDNDQTLPAEPLVIISKSTLHLIDGVGGSDSYTITLSERPTEDVIIYIYAGEGTLVNGQDRCEVEWAEDEEVFSKEITVTAKPGGVIPRFEIIRHVNETDEGNYQNVTVDDVICKITE